MIDYDSFLLCHLTDIFFAFHAGAKELTPKDKTDISTNTQSKVILICLSAIFSHGTVLV